MEGVIYCMESSQKLWQEVPPVFIIVPLLHLGRLIWRALISFILHCHFLCSFPIMLDTTDSLLGLPNSHIQHTSSCNREQSSLAFNGTVTRTVLFTTSTPRLYSFSIATGFKLNRSNSTSLKKCSIFFNLFKLLGYSNFFFHQWERPPVLNKTFRPLAKSG